MSHARAIDTIHLRSTDKVAHQETLDHPDFMRELVGFDPWTDPLQAYVSAYRALDVDWVLGLPKASFRFQPGQSQIEAPDGALVTEWGLSGSQWRESTAFTDVESVLEYEPEQDQSGASFAETVQSVVEDQALLADSAIVSGMHYKTLFQCPIMTFGWELFLCAAASEPDRFQRILEGFARVTRTNLARLAEASPELIMVHDDLALERGLVFPPEWYRSRLFPLYEMILDPILSRPGSRPRLAFVSDGDYTEVLDDLVALGFDGFIINYNMDLGMIARRIGQDHFLVGNVDTKILTLGRPEDVVAEVRRCIDDARPCAGHFIKATGDLPHNIPLDNIRTYFRAAADLGMRS